MKAMENELQDKTKVDRGLLNAWFIEVQRTKVNSFYLFLLILNTRYRKKRINVKNVVIQHSILINNFV